MGCREDDDRDQLLGSIVKKELQIFLENDPDWTRLKLAIIKNG